MRIISLSVFLTIAIVQTFGDTAENKKSNSSSWKLFANDFHPTRDEISRGFVHPAPPHWGVRIRKEKSFRILALGGSNTAVGDYGQYYVDKLRNLVLKCKFIDSKDSYVMNEGIGGTGPTRKRYPFEDDPPNRWPNIVTLEFAVNTPNQWSSAQMVDDLIFFLNAKYTEKSLPTPAYLIIELLTVRNFYPEETRHIWEFPDLKIKPTLDSSGLNNLDTIPDFDPNDEMFNRGTMGGASIDALSRFYGYPLLSTADSLFPSFLRYYTTYSNKSMWPYSKDGIHLSVLGGDTFVDHILFPFLLSELKPRDTDELYQNITSIYGKIDFRMFPRKTYAGGFVERWASWGSDYNTLQHRIVPPVEGEKSTVSFMSTPGHADGRHTCYGGSSLNSVMKIGFNIHPSLLKNIEEVESSPYRLRVGFVFSWNVSYIGKAVCTLFVTDPNDYVKKISQIGNSVHLDFSSYRGRKVHDTTLREVTIPRNGTLGANSMVLECTNLIADRHTCIGSIAIVY